MPYWKFACHPKYGLLAISDSMSMKPLFLCRNLEFENGHDFVPDSFGGHYLGTDCAHCCCL